MSDDKNALQVALAGLAGTQEAATQTLAAVGALRELYNAQTIPPARQLVELTVARPVKRVEERELAFSLGIYNPNLAIVLLGVPAGAKPGQRAIAIPPKSLVVLPLVAEDFELGLDTTDANTNATAAAGAIAIEVFRYRSVQPAFLGAVP